MNSTSSLSKEARRILIVLAAASGVGCYKHYWRQIPVAELLSDGGLLGSILAFAVLCCAALWYRAAAKGPLAWRTILSTALLFALVSALLQNGVRVAKYYTVFKPLPVTFTDYFATLPPMAFWMVPLGQILVFSTLASGVIALGLGFKSVDAQGLARFIFSFALAFDAFGLALLPSIHPVPILLIALGGAFLICRVRHVASGLRPLVVVLLMNALLALTAWAGPAMVARLRGEPAQQLANRPNVLLITLDTVRKQNLSLYGYGRPTTPRIDAFARRGIVFKRAIAPSSWTLPTHATIFTGLLPNEHRASYLCPLGGKCPTLAEQLRDAGYATAGFVGNCSYCGRRTGLARGFDHYDDLPLTPFVLLKTSALGESLGRLLLGLRMYDPRQSAEDVNAKFFHWLSSQRNRPFFAFLNYYDAHFPYSVPDRAFDRFTALKNESRRRAIFNRWVANPVDWSPKNDEEVQYGIDTYDGILAYMDHHLGRLFDHLERQGMLDNTLVIITNDHGEHFGEKGHWLHGGSLYRQLIDAPLIIAWPAAVPRGRMIEEPVSLQRIPATILDLLQVDPRRPFAGPSLAQCWLPKPPPTPSIVSEVDLVFENDPLLPLASIIVDGFHYIQSSDGSLEELYDFDHDPDEIHDISKTALAAERLPRLRELLKASSAHSNSAAGQGQPTMVPRRRFLGRDWLFPRFGQQLGRSIPFDKPVRQFH